jgi:hypothetical protein
MKIKRRVFNGFIAIFLIFAVVTGCKKKETTVITTTVNDSSTQGIIASDELNVNDEIDQAIDEAVNGICMPVSTSGATAVNLYTIKGAVVDTSQVDSGIVNIFYYGVETDITKSRSGTVEIQLPVVHKKVTPWKTVGVKAKITITAYEVMYLNTNNLSLWFQGSFTVTNVNGKMLVSLPTTDSLVEKVNGPIGFTNNDNGAILSVYSWNLCKNRVLKVTNTAAVTVTTYGDTSINGINNIADWGTDRLNQTFYTSVTSPIFQNASTPIFYNPFSGVKIIESIPEPITVTFGVNQQGAVVTTGTPYGYNINWTTSGVARDSVISY